MFGSKREEMTGERKEIHTEELYDLYSSLDVIGMLVSR
jgi:hypothetical protein